MMQDNKALQAGTSHNLGQNFAKAFDLQFQIRSGELEYAWNTAGVYRRAWSAALIMTHSDDDGSASHRPSSRRFKLVIVPIYKTDDEQLTRDGSCRRDLSAN